MYASAERNARSQFCSVVVRPAAGQLNIFRWYSIMSLQISLVRVVRFERTATRFQSEDSSRLSYTLLVLNVWNVAAVVIGIDGDDAVVGQTDRLAREIWIVRHERNLIRWCR